MSTDTLYREVGAAIHLAQTLEFNVSTLISIFNRHYGTHIDGAPLVVGNDKRTLGQLIKAIQQRAKLDEESIKALGESLESRNYLAHEFFIRKITHPNRRHAGASPIHQPSFTQAAAIKNMNQTVREIRRRVRGHNASTPIHEPDNQPDRYSDPREEHHQREKAVEHRVAR